MTVAPADRAIDARLAILVLAAEEMFDAQGPAAVEPVIDPRISANWNLVGYITGTDAIFRILGRFALGERRVFYGFVLESKATPGKFAVAIRGTAGAIEWLQDAEGLPTVARFPGLVEAGFVGIGDTFAYRAPGGNDAPLIPALKALTTGAPLAVTGHSLGSALATYVAYDAALVSPGNVSLRVFASPHPGNSTFTEAVAAVIPDHAHYRQVNDKVPEVPIALGYAQLPNTIVLQPSTDVLEIQNTWDCAHHLLSYIGLIDPSALAEAYSPQNQPYLSCLVSRATNAKPA
jgi:triacylglycerol lipase